MPWNSRSAYYLATTRIRDVKLLLLIGMAVLVIGSVFIGGFRYWLKTNQSRFAELRERANRGAGIVAARTDAEGCVVEALRRHATAEGLIAGAENQVFLRKCLTLANRPSEFCAGMSVAGEIVGLATWTVQECAQRGYGGDQGCGRLLQVIPEACEKAPRAAP